MLKFLLLIGLFGVWISAVSPIAASSLQFRERVEEGDGGKISLFVAPLGDKTLVYDPPHRWRYWQLETGGAFENRNDPYAGQLRFFVVSASSRSKPWEFEKEALSGWVKSLLPAGAEEVNEVSWEADTGKFLDSRLSKFRYTYKLEERDLEKVIWVYPVNDGSWLVITYQNSAGANFSKHVGRAENSLQSFYLED